MKIIDQVEEEPDEKAGEVLLDKRQIMKLKLYKDIIKRPDLPMDQQRRFTQKDIELSSDKLPRSAKFNQQLYLDNFGVDFTIPTFFVLDSYLWSKDPDYMFQIVKYVLPKKKYKTIQHKYNGKATLSTYQKLYGKELEGNLVLRLLYNGKHNLEVKSQLTLRDVDWAKFVESDDGSLIAILTPQVNAKNEIHREIKIYECHSNDPLKYLETIDKDECKAIFKEDASNNFDLSFINNLAFDNNNTKFVGWGKEKIFVLDIHTWKGVIHELQSDLFEQIYSLNYTTYRDKRKDRCILACKTKGKLQIQVLDYFDTGNNDCEDNLTRDQVNQLRRDTLRKKLTDKRNEGNKIWMNLKDMLIDDDEQNPIMEEQCFDDDEGVDIRFPFKIDFYNEPGEYFQVKWAKKNDCLVFLDPNEMFIVEFMPDGCHKKRKLPQMKGKIVHYMQEDPQYNGFYIICSKEYDSHLELEHSHRGEFHVNFERQVEPGIIKIFNMRLKTTVVSGQPDTKRIDLRFVGMRDDEYTYDQCFYEEQKIRNTDQDAITPFKYIQNISSDLMEPHVFAQVTAFSVNWPYVAFSGMDDYLVLFNMNAPNYVHRVQLGPPGERVIIEHTQITDTLDLFALVHIGNMYYLYRIDLESYNLTNIEITKSQPDSLFYESQRTPIFQYSENDVENQPIIQMHCRGSSHKQPIDFDNKLIVLLLHGKTLYSWTQESRTDQKMGYLDKINYKVSSGCFRIQNDNTLYFKTDSIKGKDGLVSQEIIKKMELNYSSYEMVTVYVDSDVKDTIKAFNIDNIKNKIMIICETVGIISSQPFYTFKIYDLIREEMEFSLVVKNEQLIGRLLSGLYTFVDGHIYYNNNVIKIRYDLLKKQSSMVLKEENFFNFYTNIFPLAESMRVRSNTPLNSYTSHRFAYIIQDSNSQQAKIIRILPYLHARKLFLNEVPKNTNYYYTAIETSVQAEELYNENMRNRYSDEIIDDDETESDEEDETEAEEQEEVSQYDAIVSVSITESQFAVYLQNGLLINKVDFNDIMEQYGEPCGVSTDGTKFLFKLPETKIINNMKQSNQKTVNEKGNQGKQLIKNYCTVSIFKLSVFGFTHVKDIKMLEEVKNCLKTNEGKDGNLPYTQFKIQNKWLFTDDFDEFKKNIKMDIRINDKMDICVKIQQLNPDYKTIYYYEKCGHNLNHTVLEQQKIQEPYNIEFFEELTTYMQEFQKANQKNPKTGEANQQMTKVYACQEHHEHQFQINNRSLFFHDKCKINFFDFKDSFVKSKLQKIDLEIDENEQETYIKEINMSNNENSIAIVINEDEGHCIFLWDLNNNLEVVQNDISGQYKIIWDKQGLMYILNNGGVFFMNDCWCNIKAFDYQQLDEIKSNDYGMGLGADQGVRIDNKNHNWLIVEEYLAMPFSYMAFIIKHFLETTMEEIRDDYIFDPEPYNYLLNRSNSFLDGNFVRVDPAQLQDVLVNFNQLDRLLLELLHYAQKVDVTLKKKDQLGNSSAKLYALPTESVGMDNFSNFMTGGIMQGIEDTDITVLNSPLHMAVREGNNKSVDTILLHMSKIDMNASRQFRDIFDKLIMFQNMKQYIELLPHTSSQMIKKQIIKVDKIHNKEIISMKESNCIYVDNKFYREVMGERMEDPSCSSYPVKVVAFRMGWMLKSEDHDGYQFFQEILRNEDLTWYNLKSLRMLIEFFYQKINFAIICLNLPCYLCNMILFVVVAIINETLRTYYKINKEKGVVEGTEKSSEWTNILISCLFLNLFFVLIQTSISYFMFKKMGTRYFRRFWSWIDITIFIFSIAIIAQYFAMISKKNDQGYFTQNYDTYMSSTITLRIMLTIGQLVLFLKTLQFLTMVDKIASLVSIFLQIFTDIFGFLIILLIFMFTFIFAFWILAQNQKDFDELTKQEEEAIQYLGFVDSMLYVGAMLLGGPDDATASFTSGKGKMEVLLIIVFWLSVFIIMIHLLNMLIAIMGNTFEVGNQSMEQQKYREHLRFVVDNWFMRKFAFKDIERVKYIVTAFSSNDDESHDPIFEEIKDEITEKTDDITEQLKKQDDKIKDIQRSVDKFMKQIDPDG